MLPEGRGVRDGDVIETTYFLWDEKGQTTSYQISKSHIYFITGNNIQHREHSQ